MKTPAKVKRSAVKVQAKAPGYDAPKGRGANAQLDAATIEKKSESKLITERERLKLIAMQRDSLRNTVFSPATAQQVQINTVGTVGGKLTVTTADARFNEEASGAFRSWARQAGFTDAMHFNEQLSLMATLLTHNGGDFIAMFDNGELTTAPGSGRLAIFESDQIKPVDEGIFRKLYGDRAYQDHGLVKDRFARIIGAFVGARRDDDETRGDDTFKEGEFLHLKLKTPADFSDSSWTFVANTWRPNQGRGIATATYAVGEIQHMADIIASEIIAGKLNSSIGLIEKNTDGTATDDSRREFIGADEADGLTEEELAAYNSDLRDSVKALQTGGAAIFREMPGRSLESFKADRPAVNTVEFVKKIEGMATTPFGFGRLFATLDPESSYIASRGAMVLARKSFERLQKKLERNVLDWLAPKVLKYYGLILPANIADCLFWTWPDMVEIDESAFQTALEKRYSNFESTLKSRHGAEWRKYVDALSEEVAYCAEHGILHPCLRTVSGGQVEAEPAPEEKKEGEK